MTRRAIGGHHSAAAISTTWLTPPHVLDALGGWQEFDLDPCAAPDPRPWPTARHMNALADGDGLAIEWTGRVWLNGPYGSELASWLAKLGDHGAGFWDRGLGQVGDDLTAQAHAAGEVDAYLGDDGLVYLS